MGSLRPTADQTITNRQRRTRYVCVNVFIGQKTTEAV